MPTTVSSLKAEATAGPSASPAAARIVVRELSKSFEMAGQALPAVDRVSFELRQGEFVALLGPSGCGKSTILNMIAGLIPRTGGDIKVDGVSVETGKVMPQVGYVFQRDTVFPWRTVARNIGSGCRAAISGKEVT